MTITTTTRSVTHTGNGATTIWPFTFIIPDDDSHIVSLIEIATGDETVLLTSQYSISGLNDEAGGSVTYPISGSPLSADYRIVITREVPRTQPVNITRQTRFFADVVMGVWDRLTMMIQELSEESGRTLQTRIDDGAITTLPIKTARANMLLGFDASGNPVASIPGGASVPVTPAMEPLITAPTIADGRNVLQASHSVVAVSTTTSISSAHRSKFLRCTNAVTLNLESAATLGDGWFVAVMATNGDVVIDPDGGELVDGETTLTVREGDYVTLACNGSEFYVIKHTRSRLFTEFITSGSGTYIVPAHVRQIEVEGVGAGGGSGAVNGQGASKAAISGPGGGGGYFRKVIPVSPGDSFTYSIGVGGNGGAAPSGNGSDGSDTTFTDGVSLNLVGGGGSGGVGTVADANMVVSCGAPGVASGGDINIDGGKSAFVRIYEGKVFSNPPGGSSFFSHGGPPASSLNNAGNSAQGYGGGGSSAIVSATFLNNYAGGAGSDGLIIIRGLVE